MKNVFLIAGSHVTILLFATVLIAGGQKQGGTKPLSAYSSVLVSNFEIDKTPATEDFPKGLEKLMQSRAAKELRERKVFAEVVDGSDAPIATSAGQGSPSKQVILSANIVSYDKGSRAARAWVSVGAGESKGMNTTYGGSQDDASLKPAISAVKEMIKKLEMNR